MPPSQSFSCISLTGLTILEHWYTLGATVSDWVTSPLASSTIPVDLIDWCQINVQAVQKWLGPVVNQRMDPDVASTAIYGGIPDRNFLWDKFLFWIMHHLLCIQGDAIYVIQSGWWAEICKDRPRCTTWVGIYLWWRVGNHSGTYVPEGSWRKQLLTDDRTCMELREYLNQFINWGQCMGWDRKGFVICWMSNGRSNLGSAQ